jgi:phosphomannomutase/phosphoglucomutase
MVDIKMERPRLSAAQLKPLLIAVMVLGIVLAAWFAWNAWGLQRDSMRRDTVRTSRDAAVQTAQSGLR